MVVGSLCRESVPEKSVQELDNREGRAYRNLPGCRCSQRLRAACNLAGYFLDEKKPLGARSKGLRG